MMGGTGPSSGVSDGWRLLAEIQAPAGQANDSHVSAWLDGTLRPLELHTELVGRVQKTARECLSPLEGAGIELNRTPVCLRIYAQARSMLKQGSSRNWGYYHIKKSGFEESGENFAGTLIEFYFYQES